jgi:hypothetical protein
MPQLIDPYYGQFILTVSQKNQVQGQLYSDSQFFNCVQDINDKWFLFLTGSDIATITGTQWDWILQCPTGEYTPPPPPPFPS